MRARPARSDRIDWSCGASSEVRPGWAGFDGSSRRGRAPVIPAGGLSRRTHVVVDALPPRGWLPSGATHGSDRMRRTRPTWSAAIVCGTRSCLRLVARATRRSVTGHRTMTVGNAAHSPMHPEAQGCGIVSASPCQARAHRVSRPSIQGCRMLRQASASSPVTSEVSRTMSCRHPRSPAPRRASGPGCPVASPRHRPGRRPRP